MEKFDVVIVGAGPGGLKCAEVLAKSGKEVVIFEKNKVVGPKVCAGGVTLKAMRYGLPEKLLGRKFKSFKYFDRGKCIIVGKDEPIVATLKREDLGQWQLDVAEKAGAEVRTDSKVTEVGEGYVVVNDDKVKFDYLVGADGVGSVVRKSLGLGSDRMHLACQYIVNKELEYIEVHFDSGPSVSYSWIFPHKGFASVGYGIDPRKDDALKAKKRFKQWMEERGIEHDGAKFESMPILYDYKGYRFGNKFLVGEAAGLTYGLSGEGIYPALASGEDVANLILDKNYDPKNIKKILKKKRIQDILIYLLKTPLGNAVHMFGLILMKTKRGHEWGIRLTLG